jgi:hypothetical protein
MKVLRGIKGLWIYLWGNIIFRILYDKKYINSKYFKSKYWGIGAIGWTWVVSDFWGRLFFGNNKKVSFPVSPRITVTNSKNIHFDIDDLNNFQGFGNYYQSVGTGCISIGKGSWIAPNVGIITANHNINDLISHEEAKDVVIGEYCWIGMNSTILPGVVLGPKTIVGAGSVVTKSFVEGNCIIVGNPARKIKSI